MQENEAIEEYRFTSIVKGSCNLLNFKKKEREKGGREKGREIGWVGTMEGGRKRFSSSYFVN
jgi:hypothetical protein